MTFQIGFLFNLKHKITLFYLLSFVFIRFMTRCHSLSLIVTLSYSLSFVVISCHLLYHSLSLVVSFVVICCTTRYHLLYHYLSFVVPLAVIRYHSLSFDVTRCTTRLSFYKRSLFYNFLLFTSFIIKAKTKNKHVQQ